MKKKLKIVIFSIAILIVFQSSSFARYYESLKNIYGKATIAEPIVKVEALQEPIITEFNKNTQAKEYYFTIKNYEINSNNEKRISEVDFEFAIQIKNSENTFPIKYELYECDTGNEILNGNNTTEKIVMEKSKVFDKKYKLKVLWNSNIQAIAANDNIEIIVEAFQK